MAARISIKHESICDYCDHCACISCNCRLVKAQRSAGFYVCQITAQRISLQTRAEVKLDLFKRLAPLAFFRSVAMSCMDDGKGSLMKIDLILLSKPSKKDWSLILELLAGLYSDIERAEASMPISTLKEETNECKITNNSEITLSLEGLSCNSCAMSIDTALRTLDGMIDAKVDFPSQTAFIKYNQSKLSLAKIVQKIEDVGFIVILDAIQTGMLILTREIPSASSLIKTVFNLTGMSCASCVSSLENVLKAVPGVDPVSLVATLLPQRISLVHNPQAKSVAALKTLIEEIGFEVIYFQSSPFENEPLIHGPKSQEVAILVGGMTCASCVNSIEAYMKKQPGIINTSVNLITAKATVTFNPDQLGIREVINMISETGFSATLATFGDNRVSNNELNQYAKEMFIAFIFAVPSFIVSMVVFNLIRLL